MERTDATRLRVSALSMTYKRLAEFRIFAGGMDGYQIARALSEIATDVEIYGTEEEARLAAEAVEGIMNRGSLEKVDALLQAMLDHLRGELGLERIPRGASVFAFRGSPPRDDR